MYPKVYLLKGDYKPTRYLNPRADFSGTVYSSQMQLLNPLRSFKHQGPRMQVMQGLG